MDSPNKNLLERETDLKVSDERSSGIYGCPTDQIIIFHILGVVIG